MVFYKVSMVAFIRPMDKNILSDLMKLDKSTQSKLLLDADSEVQYLSEEQVTCCPQPNHRQAAKEHGVTENMSLQICH